MDDTTQNGCFDPRAGRVREYEERLRAEPAFARMELDELELGRALTSALRIRALAALLAGEAST